MQTSSQNKMAVQPIAPLMFRIGLPIVLSMILQAAYNVVDSAYLARMTTGGEDALTALSLAFPVQLFMVAVSIGTGVGTNALLAKLLGLGDRGSANRTVGNAQTLAIILSAVFMLFSLLGVRPYVYSQSAGGSISPEVLDMAIDYLHICCGIPFGIVLFSLSETTLPMCIDCMRIVSLGFVFAGLCIAFQGVFQALECGIESLVISLCRQVLFVLPPVWLLSQMVTGAGNMRIVWVPLAVGEMVTLCIALVMFRRVKKSRVDSIPE